MYHVNVHRTNPNLLKNNPDVQYDTDLQGYWIRPESKTHVLMLLNGTFDGTTATMWYTNINGPDWKDYD